MNVRRVLALMAMLTLGACSSADPAGPVEAIAAGIERATDSIGAGIEGAAGGTADAGAAAPAGSDEVESLMRLNADGVRPARAYRTVRRTSCAAEMPRPPTRSKPADASGPSVVIALGRRTDGPAPGRRVYQVQLASYLSVEHACRGWNVLRRKAPELLGDVEHTVHEARAGAEDAVYFRLRTAPVADQNDAEHLCAELHSRDIGCLILESAAPPAS